MRNLAAAVVVLFLFGCVAEQPAEPAMNVTENIGEEEISGNVSETSGTNESGDFVEVNETNESGETVAEEVPETIPEKEPEGTVFGGGKYIITLDDVVWYGDTACAAVRIAYVEGETLKRDVICPDSDYYWHSPGGQQYRIRVAEVAGGYGGERWAEIYIYG